MPTVATENRYFFEEDTIKRDPISGERPPRLKFHAGGEWIESKTSKYMPCYNPSTGAVIAYAPQCTADEVELAIAAAEKAYPAWSNTPVGKRVQVLFKMKTLVEENLDELTRICATENGKKWDESWAMCSRWWKSSSSRWVRRTS
jgi:malonate-semialdehyde dehydrogenase (acetylating)/methylmalonate-semialdehyde dehydrogenase